MPTFHGTFSRTGIGRDPVVFIDEADHPRMEQWWDENGVFTQVMRHRHPQTGVQCPVIYIAESAASRHEEGTHVAIAVDVRPEVRGNGVRVISVE